MLRFGPQIAIRVSPEVFFLTKGDASLSLPTYLYIDSTAANPRVVAVGEEISGVPELVRIDLFGSSLQASPPLRVGLLECLAAFLRAGVQKLVGRRTMIKMAGHCHGSRESRFNPSWISGGDSTPGSRGSWRRTN